MLRKSKGERVVGLLTNKLMAPRAFSSSSMLESLLLLRSGVLHMDDVGDPDAAEGRNTVRGESDDMVESSQQ